MQFLSDLVLFVLKNHRYEIRIQSLRYLPSYQHIFKYHSLCVSWSFCNINYLDSKID